MFNQRWKSRNHRRLGEEEPDETLELLAKEAAGGHQWGGQSQQVLGSGAVQ